MTIMKEVAGGQVKLMTLTVTARGQLTLKKEVLQHLGIRPGDEIDLDLLPDASGLIKATRSRADIGGFVGLLAGRSRKVATVEEITEASATAWAGDHR